MGDVGERNRFNQVRHSKNPNVYVTSFNQIIFNQKAIRLNYKLTE